MTTTTTKGCGQCGQRTWFLFRVWLPSGGICGTCCNANNAIADAAAKA